MQYVVPGYEIIGLPLASGGMGIVFEARQKSLNRLVALKTIKPGLIITEKARERFLREALAVAMLTHPHIVQIYDYGEAAGLPYQSMEYMAGGTLAKKLAGTPLPFVEAARLAEWYTSSICRSRSLG
jgi:serine/threonine-protein kinase